MATISHRSQRASSSVGTFQAKTHFSELLERVAHGEEITITKHDRPVARLIPANRTSRTRIAEVFQQMDSLRQSLKKSKDKTSLKELINRGRRF